MAQAPMPMAPMPGAAVGGMGGDPMAGAADDADTDADDTVVVTICKNGDGSYTVYPGDEPESGAGDADMGEDDAASMDASAAPMAPEAQGQPADSIGAALKAALDIMQADASSEGAPGSAQDQFSAGFSADKAPRPVTGSAPQRF